MSDRSLTARMEAVHTHLVRDGVPCRTHESLAAHTTFRIGGPAALAAFPETAAQVRAVLDACRREQLPCALVGNGSNLLCPDEGFSGCVLFTAAMKNVTVNETVITAGAGAALASVCCTARDAGLAGLSFAYGIPGTVGGAVSMNAGAYGGEIGDRILTVTALDADTGELRTYTREDCAFGYRTSAFIGTHHIVLEATLSTDPGDPAAIRAEMEDITARRREKQPLEYPSAGSAFKRYPGYFTAQLIDEAGLKGYTVGGAQVSEKHAGFIVNRGGATCEDVLTLIDAIRAKIRALHSIEIEPEIRCLDECIVVPAEGMLST